MKTLFNWKKYNKELVRRGKNLAKMVLYFLSIDISKYEDRYVLINTKKRYKDLERISQNVLNDLIKVVGIYPA